MGMVRPEVRLAYRRGSTDSGSADRRAMLKLDSDGDLKSSGIDEGNFTSRPTRLTPNQEDDIANPADRTS